MEEDAFSQLLRKHFIKVNQCLENHKNFDILTRFSFCSSPDKAIDDTKYQYPEVEYQQEELEPRIVSNFQISTQDVSSSVLIKEETNAKYRDQNNTSCSVSSIANSKDESKSKILRDEYGDVSSEYFKREHFLKRPETPMLQMYDFDESEVCSLSSSLPGVERIEASKKFIHSMSLPILNDSITTSEDQIVLSVSNFDEAEDGAVNSTIFDSIQSVILDENQRSFEDELEEYKKEIKAEKVIKSLSADDNIPNAISKSRIDIPSCDSCSRVFRREDLKDEFRLPIIHDFSDHNRLYDIDAKFDDPPNVANTAEYLKYLLEESSTNFYHGVVDSKSSSDIGFLPHNKSKAFQRNVVMDDDMIEEVLTKFLKSQVNNAKSNVSAFSEAYGLRREVIANSEIFSMRNNFDAAGYIKMNHLEIQKELTRRIEDMYKAGDGN